MALVDLDYAKRDLKQNALAYLILALLLPGFKNLDALGIETSFSSSLPSTWLCLLLSCLLVSAGLLVRYRAERLGDFD